MEEKFIKERIKHLQHLLKRNNFKASAILRETAEENQKLSFILELQELQKLLK